MADSSDIAQVRLNTNEPTDATYSDDYIGGLIDADGVAAASASIWRAKAAKFSELVNTTEGGTQHNFSDLSKNALAMAKAFDVTEAVAEAEESHTVIKTITR